MPNGVTASSPPSTLLEAQGELASCAPHQPRVQLHDHLQFQPPDLRPDAQIGVPAHPRRLVRERVNGGGVVLTRDQVGLIIAGHGVRLCFRLVRCRSFLKGQLGVASLLCVLRHVHILVVGCEENPSLKKGPPSPRRPEATHKRGVGPVLPMRAQAASRAQQPQHLAKSGRD